MRSYLFTSQLPRNLIGVGKCSRQQTADSRQQTVSRLAVTAVLFIFALSFASLPARAQLVITGTHTITVAEGEVVSLSEEVIGNASSVLNIFGAGRTDLSAASPGFRGTAFIRGAEFRLHGPARMNGGSNAFFVTNGGTFTLDTTGPQDVDQLSNSSNVTLAAGTFRVLAVTQGAWGENFGRLSLISGANTIHIQKNAGSTGNHIRPNMLLHSGTATLNLTSNVPYGTNANTNVRIRMRTPIPADFFAINGIIPWASVAGADWLSFVATDNTSYWLVPLSSYHAGAPSTWTAADNVRLASTLTTLSADTQLNSLNIVNSSRLSLGGYGLFINAGGLLTTGAGANTRIMGSGTVTTAAGRPLYIHIYGDSLILEDEVAFSGSIDLVKTGPGTLLLDSDTTHELGNLTINQGTVLLLKGWLSTSGVILVGDGAGEDIIEIGADLENPIIIAGGDLPSFALHGNLYGPTTDAAMLRLGGNTRQALATLHIQDRGTLNFIGTSIAQPNILYLDQLTLSDTNARLAIRNWNDQADYLLVRRNWGETNVPPILAQIHFEGYGPARWQPHYLTGFDDYWQITPLPEPSTYSALLTALGLSLVIYHRRKNDGGRTVDAAVSASPSPSDD